MKRFFKDNYLYILAGIGVLLLFSLRFYNLTILPVFVDEAIYIRWAQIMKAEETLRFLPLSDGKQPLFMWITMGLIKFINDPLLAGRTVSVLSGLGTLVGITVLSYLLFKNKKVSLIAAFIYSLSPFTFFFDRMALVDSMLTMFGVWTFIFSYLAIKYRRLDCAIVAGFTLGGAWLTKSPALFFALMLPSLWIFANWQKNINKNIVVFLKSLSLSLVSIFIGFGFYNILRLGPNFHLIASRNLDYVYPFSHLFTSFLDPLKPFLLQSWQWIVMMGPFSLIALWLIGYMVNLKLHWKELIVLTVWFLGPILVEAEFAKVLTARYILISIPFLIILAASAFNNLSMRWLRVSVYAFSIIFIFQSLFFDYRLLVSPAKANLPRSERSGYLEDWTAGHGIYEAANIIKNYQSQNPGKKIVVGTEGYFGTLPDGLQAYLNQEREITVIGVGLNFSKVPTSLIMSQDAGNATFLVINDSRFNGDLEEENLELIASFPKATKPDGSHESLLVLMLR